jgi:putative ABC transport system substrate-binding protein
LQLAVEIVRLNVDVIVTLLSRPGGNVTGSSFLYGDLNAKRVDLLKAAIPNLARVGVLVNPDTPPLSSSPCEASSRSAGSST